MGIVDDILDNVGRKVRKYLTASSTYKKFMYERVKDGITGSATVERYLRKIISESIGSISFPSFDILSILKDGLDVVFNG